MANSYNKPKIYSVGQLLALCAQLTESEVNTLTERVKRSSPVGFDKAYPEVATFINKIESVNIKDCATLPEEFRLLFIEAILGMRGEN